MKNTLFAIALCSMSLSYAQIGETKCPDQIFGTWTNSDFGYNMVLVFKEDGSCQLDGNDMNFNCTDGKLVLEQKGLSERYDYEIKETELVLLEAGSGLRINLKRSGATSNTSQVKPEIKTPEKQTVGTKNDGLVGVWVGYDEKIEFYDNGTCLYSGMTLNYETYGTTLTLQGQGGAVQFTYAVNTDQLTINAEGKTYTYMREGAEVKQQVNSAGTKKIAQELVGRWCWTNVNSTNTGGSTSEKCLELNANGTYKYNSERTMDANTDAFYVGTNSQSSDFGTWSYDGVRIYYTSQNGQGTGSYVLEKRNHPKNGDPMIVLDGETYVTYYQKNPW